MIFGAICCCAMVSGTLASTPQLSVAVQSVFVRVQQLCCTTRQTPQLPSCSIQLQTAISNSRLSLGNAVTPHSLSRCRVFMWGAKSGREQLPAFPEPTHRTFGLTNRGAKQFTTKGQKDHVDCRVDFLTPERREAAHPPVSQGWQQMVLFLRFSQSGGND